MCSMKRLMLLSESYFSQEWNEGQHFIRSALWNSVIQSVKNVRGQKNFRTNRQTHRKIRRGLAQESWTDVFAVGHLKSFKMVMRTLDSQLLLSLWCFKGF